MEGDDNLNAFFNNLFPQEQQPQQAADPKDGEVFDPPDQPEVQVPIMPLAKEPVNLGVPVNPSD